MTNRVALDNVAHATLRVALRHGAAFGDQVNQVTLFPGEFEEAQREFPILFRRGEGGAIEAVALLGLDRDENLFLDGDRWTSRHIPLLQQRGPFSIGLPDGPDAPPLVHVTLDDPRVGDADGQPLFLDHGGNAPYLDHVERVLGLIYAGVQHGPAMYAMFDALGLLEPIAFEAVVQEDRRYVVEGFERLSRGRLDALSASGLEQLQRAGHLVPAVLAATSLGNISGLIARKNVRRA
jgi:hypothetical protein